VYHLVKIAFATVPYSDGTEAEYLNQIRTDAAFIPQLSLVAQRNNGQIIGQIVLYKTEIITKEQRWETLVLSPICVHPDYFRQGVASAMMANAFSRAINMNYGAVFLCGEPAIYRPLGFKPSFEHRIYHKDDPHADWCMVRELIEGTLSGVTGIIDIV
jgi:predicted N-acetyltransferase YhbS